MKTIWTTLGVFALVVAVSLLIALLLAGEKEDEVSMPITCTVDYNCGGAIETERFCNLGVLYARGQRNTCVNAGTEQSECITTYEPWKVADNCEGPTS